MLHHPLKTIPVIFSYRGSEQYLKAFNNNDVQLYIVNCYDLIKYSNLSYQCYVVRANNVFYRLRRYLYDKTFIFDVQYDFNMTQLLKKIYQKLGFFKKNAYFSYRIYCENKYIKNDVNYKNVIFIYIFITFFYYLIN